MTRANPRREIRDLHVRGNPPQIGVPGQQSIIIINPLFVVLTVWSYQQFGHSNGRRNGCRTGLFEPGENHAGERLISRARFQLIDENGRVQSYLAMPVEEISKAV